MEYFSFRRSISIHLTISSKQTKTLGINAINADHCPRLTVITFGLLLDGLSRHQCTREGVGWSVNKVHLYLSN